MNISKYLRVAGAGLGLVAQVGWGRAVTDYSVTAPPVFPILNTDQASAWANSNASSVVWMSGGSAMTASNRWPEAIDTTPETPKSYRLLESQIGCPLEHIKPEYYLGDMIIPPDEVNWDETYSELLTNSTDYLEGRLFFEPSVPGIFISEGGTLSIEWKLLGGGTESHSYQVSSSPKSKPYRIYWTDAPYNGPQVDLSGKFVKFYGDPNLTIAQTGMVSSISGGMPTEVNTVTNGLYRDSSTQWLQARGTSEGRVVMVYYETGSYEKCLTNVVVEVCEPDVKTVSAGIGGELLPSGDGYDCTGLLALITAGLDSADGIGPYLYQHKGDHSYSPKDGSIYAIRKTTGEPWKIEVYWEQTDVMDTSWPFEVLHYSCDWSADAELLVRGNVDGDTGLTIPIPDDYTAELQEFQEPVGHAVLSDDTFYTTQAGYSLLKLQGDDVHGDDNVWFLPIRSILRDDPQFDLTPNIWPVATKVKPLSTFIALDLEGDAKVDTGITNLNGSFTVEGWFQIVGDGVQALFSSEYEVLPNGYQYDFIVEYDGGELRASIGSGSTNDAYSVVLNGGPITRKEWMHVAFSYDHSTSTATLYVNGLLKDFKLNEFDRPNNPDLYTLVLGAGERNGETNTYYDVLMDDVRIWSAARSLDQIKENSIGFLHSSDSDEDLVAYYPVENTLGRVLQDHSGNGHHAPIVNGSRVASGAIGLTDLEGFDADHAYIYEPVSGDNYNVNLYMRPDEMTSGDDSAVDAGEESTDDETYVFGVNTNSESIEIWWSHEVNQEAMPSSLWFPAWVQKYLFKWPGDDYMTPEIVLCSQKGSAGESVVKAGVALDLSESANSYMKIPSGEWFSGNQFTVEFWIKPHSAEDGGTSVFNFYNEGVCQNGVSGSFYGDGAGSACHFSFEVCANNDEVHDVQTPCALELGTWQHLALSVDSGIATVYLNGEKQGESVEGFPAINLSLTNNFIGGSRAGDGGGSFDGQIDEFRIWSVARSSNDIDSAKFTPLAGDEDGLKLYYDFDTDPRGTAQACNAYDKVNVISAAILYGDWVVPGAPRLDAGVLMADEAPIVYYQNDLALPGYNPNEEHAFIRAEAGGYVTYALRNDLNQDNSSKPYVLVQYNDSSDENRPNMQIYHVVETNSVYTNFSATNTAGTTVPGPHPLDYLSNPWMLDTYWDAAGADRNDCPGYRDRKGQIWAKNAGADGTSAELKMYNYYPMQEGFYFPGMTPQPGLSDPISWQGGMQNEGIPQLWTWTVKWPEISSVLDVGQTLTEPVNGLPEVWNAQSMRVIHEPVSGVAALYDPTVIQTTGLAFDGDFMETFGFAYGDNAYASGGYTCFNGVPPNVGSRFFFNPNAPSGSCLQLRGNWVDHEGGLSYLQLNVLNHKERTALIGLVDSNNEHFFTWETAIDALAIERVDVATSADYSGQAAYPDSPYAATSSDSFELVDSIPVDHYALTHMGTASGYVTLIENDARDPACGVSSGDPINMHIIELSTHLYAGSVLPLEDSNNLLSEQLDILYTESFAGDAQDFEFEWKKAEPNENGTTPTDYEHQFDDYLLEAGTTRFTIGKQGDTLDNMVNTFYVMRYRATTNASAYAVTGDTWSDWCGPTLAEGWVQRVLNNITPFTQRMQDLANNKVETQVSMIQQAGAPYEGDVSLNQDNLTQIGLIQLYQTLLNKAESMSIRLGINNTAANQQLMLAATRLNDLYMLLGNEAFADAMDPTIGFGSDFVNTETFMVGSVDYGSMHSSLFCFDNLEPNLRDEELALLRGRSDDLAPSIQLGPTYNRLYWNYSKGITAGEVAYSQNYQILGADVVIDQPQAAALYPQGHGDAWGHYLSALNGYYRLMRNPNFSWGTPSITPLMVGDAVVDADYYDEEKFAESAASMARAGAEVVTRTCEKSFVENDGTPLAGYRDEDSSRAFGYGEWGARAGLASLYNWAAANSLLPAEGDPLSFDFMTFATNTQLECEHPADEIDFTQDFTLEFKIKPDAVSQSETLPVYLFDWHSKDGARSADGAVSIYLNYPSKKLHVQVSGVTNSLYMNCPAMDEWSHVAITYSAMNREMCFYLNGEQDLTGPYNAWLIIPDSVNCSNAVIRLAASDSPAPFIGALAEFRIWNSIRTPAEIQASEDGVSAHADNLLMYQRLIADASQGGRLPDEACDSIWVSQYPQWIEQTLSGVALNFSDDSISRINRSSIGSLAELSSAMSQVQRSVDQADAGMTPLGLSDGAIPFDIDPAELAAGKSHFEQILERAETALGNAESLLNRAQGVSKLQRQQAQSDFNTQQDLAGEEAAMLAALINVFGFPYEDDIGPGKTYPQAYYGPDLYHYMWMDLEQYGFDEFDLGPVTSKVVEVNNIGVWINQEENESETLELDFEIAANGMVLRPDSIEGTRRSQGSLQTAYGSFIQAYLSCKKALLTYEEKEDYLDKEAVWSAVRNDVLTAQGVETTGYKIKALAELLRQGKITAKIARTNKNKKEKDAVYMTEMVTVPKVSGVGTCVVIDPGTFINGSITVKYAIENAAWETKLGVNKSELTKSEKTIKSFEILMDYLNNMAKLTFDEHQLVAGIEKLVMESNDAAMALDVAYAAMINAQESYRKVLWGGQALLAKQERTRKQSANRIAAGRYQDMAFRTFRNEALTQYSTAFDLAKKYTYLATSAYDYEAALGLDDVYTSDSIFRDIVGTRSLGHLVDGEPQLGGIHGDGGLADILARLKSNWLVIDSRLGINNAQVERKWLSLREECFRIKPASLDNLEVAQTWVNTLESYRVDDLLDVPEFRRYCLPFESSYGLEAQEPGLVIPFSTTIDFAKNVFGWPLASGDHSFDSSHYATKIRKVGVRFTGYNMLIGDATTPALADEPRVYLIPVGSDVMRSPGSDGGDLLAYNVVDQVVPMPFPLNGADIDGADWMSIYDSYTGSGDPLATIRRYPSLRAFPDSITSEDDMISSTRLVGRSVWNTQWLLIIPAGTLHNDRDFALDTLIKGGDLNQDGIWDQIGIQDIEIGFETYSNSGN